MKYVLCLLVALPLSSFAQRNSRENLERDVQKNLRETREVVLSNLQQMTDRELRKVDLLLNQIKETASGDINAPIPVPVPVPRPVVRCADDNPGLFQETFIQIKEFAFSSEGLNLTSANAKNYATEWTNKNPCSKAVQFMSDFKRLKDFAFSSEGLNKTARDAVNFAEEKINVVCSHVPFETLFIQHYNFAFSSEGLNMTSAGARNYAYPKIEQLAFSCNNR